MNRRSSVGNKTAAAVIEHHFGKAPRHVKRLTGGISNHVFEARIGRENVVVRISDDPAKLQDFQKEQWAVRKARAVKVPAPEILEVGNAVIHLPYMISVKAPGEDASRSGDRMEVVRAMAQYAARINSISTHGFGRVFDWSRNQLSRNNSWRSFLKDELKVQDRLELFAKTKILSPTALKKLTAEVRQMSHWNGRPSLTHGDIRLKNVLLDTSGKIVSILDWENCTSNLAPYWELSIALHDLCIDEKEAFLEGYGMSPKDYAKAAPGIKALNILNYSETIRMAVDKNDKARFQAIRVRLSGAFDLCSL